MKWNAVAVTRLRFTKALWRHNKRMQQTARFAGRS
jgi:hypothetical protein